MNTIWMHLKYMIVICVCLLAVDSIYLYLIAGDLFQKMIHSIQRSDISLRYSGIVLCYFFLTIGLYYFIILHRKSMAEAFLLGIVIYSVYDTTNYATIRGWKPWIAIMDAIWGGTLFAITTGMVYFVMERRPRK